MHETAQIITSYGRRYIVRTNDKRTYEASTRSKRSDFACGDWVSIDILNDEQAVIEDVQPRQSLLYRQDAYKSKLIAAEAAQINAVILLNKTDLPGTEHWRERLSFYTELGYNVIELSAKQDVRHLLPVLWNHTNILLGQSGMGKSTITNALLGDDRARTADISTALDSGKHTTTHAQLYDLDEETQLIDSPGLQEFGLHHLAPEKLPCYFPDLHPLMGQCRFHNCTHRAEPDCAFKAAAEKGEIHWERLALLQKITDELMQ